MKTLKTIIMAAMFLAITSGAFAMDEKGQMKQDKYKKQTSSMQKYCPVMGGEINRELYVEAKGKRIYVCCPACIGKIKANPDKYIKELTDKGITLEDIQKM